jgi:hypothetical protein
MKLKPLRDDDWVPPWTCPITGKWQFTFAPDFSGLDPDTGEPWSPRKVVQLLGLKMASSDDTRAACEKVVSANPDKVASYRAGKTNMLGFFIKLVMEETHKQASPKDASAILTELLKSPAKPSG